MADETINSETQSDPISSNQKAVSTSDNIQSFNSGSFRAETDLAFISAGAGSYYNQLQTFLTCLDRYQRNVLPINSEHSGLTFITRPKLNLRSTNLRQNRFMTALDSYDTTSIPFMIRCLLDTKFAKDPKMANYVLNSPLVDYFNPFLTPLCNACVGVSNLPDYVMHTETTQGGFHSEDQTYAIGSDNFNKTYEIDLTFKDIQHGIIAAILHYWLEYIRNVCKGLMIAYKEDIDQQVLNYTVSIYRFNLDPTKRFITKYCKCTGCFPTALPIGRMLSASEDELWISAATKFSIRFVVNKVEYNDYAILNDFNRLVKRYCPTIEDMEDMGWSPIENYRGLPFIKTTREGIQMCYKRVPNPVFSQPNDIVDQLLNYTDNGIRSPMSTSANGNFLVPGKDYFMVTDDDIAKMKKFDTNPKNKTLQEGVSEVSEQYSGAIANM